MRYREYIALLKLDFTLDTKANPLPIKILYFLYDFLMIFSIQTFKHRFLFCDGTYKCAMHIRCWTTPTIGKYLKRFLGSIPSQYFLIAIFRIGQVCRIILLCCRFFSCRRSYVEPIGSHLDTV